MKKKITWGVIAFVIIISSVVWYHARRIVKSEFTSIRAARGVLDQTVEGTGTVTAATDANLNFDIVGPLVDLPVKVSDHVANGQLIARLNTNTLDASITEQAGALKRAEADVAQALAGSTDEVLAQFRADVQKAQANLNKAEVDLDNATASNSQSLQDAYANMISAMQGSIQPMEAGVTDVDAILGVVNTSANQTFQKGITDLDNRSTYVGTAKSDFASARAQLSTAKTAVANLTLGVSTSSEIEAAIPLMKDALAAMATTLNDTWTVLDKMDLSASGLSITTINASKTILDADRSSVNTKLSAVLTQEQKVASSRLNYGSTTSTQNASAVAQAQANVKIYQAALDSAQASLAQKEAKPRDVDIAALKAAVTEAEGAYQNAAANREKAYLRAPFSGTVTKVNYKLGEQVRADTPVASLFADNEFKQIEVNISENDIAKVHLGESAHITLDALGADRVFFAQVSAIDPAETVISDVVYYKVTLQIAGTYKADKTVDTAISASDLKDIKPGMTANVIIATAHKENVLMVPERAIVEKGGVRYIRVVTDIQKGAYEERPVQTGLRGGDAEIEVMSGIREGEQIITFLKM